MGLENNKTISIKMPRVLLMQIDELAKRDYVTRSDLIRRIALEYVRDSDLDLTEVKQPPANKSPRPPQPPPEPKRDYEKLAKKYPYVHRDRQLLEFLDDYEQGKL